MTLQILTRTLTILSIIQNSPTDWASEASTMSMVYQNSTCTIAACEGTSSDDSMLTDRDVDSGKVIEVHKQFADRKVTLQPIPDWHQAIRSAAPLFQRGWTLQERFLSPRIIYMSRFPFWSAHPLDLFTRFVLPFIPVPAMLLDPRET